MTSAFAGDLNVRSILAVIGLTIVGGGLLAWALKQTTLEDAQSDPQALFMKRNPCPANGNTRGACRGYVVHHIKPLCAGGADRPSNMQWLPVAAAKKKDRLDTQECRAHRKQQQKKS